MAPEVSIHSRFSGVKGESPEHPDPRVNLALTMERAGRIGEALDLYRATLEVSPDYLPAVQGIANLTLRAGRRDEPKLARWLDAVALLGQPVWREWARGELAGRRSD